MIGPGSVIQRAQPSGRHRDQQLAADPEPHFGIIARSRSTDGKVFFCNGGTSTGLLYSFDADLTERWSVSVPFATIGGPAMARTRNTSCRSGG